MSEVRIRVRVDDDTHAGLTRVRASLMGVRGRLTADFRRLGDDLGVTITTSAGQQMGQGFRLMGSNPYVMAGLAILGTVVASALAAALAGAIALAFGGAFVGLGVYLLKDLPEVKQKWSGTLKDIKQEFTDAAKPLLPAIENARVKLKSAAGEFAPHFKTAMEAATPYITKFTDDLFDGMEKFGKKAWQPMMDAFNLMVGDVLGPELEGMLSTLGKSFRALGNTVKNHSVEIGQIFHVLLGIIPLVIDSINFLANAWFTMSRAATAAIGGIIKYAIAPMVDTVLRSFGIIVDAAAKAFGWIPGIGSKIRNAQKEFHGATDGMGKDIARTGQKIMDLGKTWDRENKRRKLKMDIAEYDRKIKAAKAKLKSVPNSKKSKLKADISDLVAKRRKAQSELNKLHDKTVTVRVNALFPNNIANKAYTGILARRASGGLVGYSATAATGGIRSNSVLVGEHGPEVVDLAPGSRVRSNPDSRRLMHGSGGSALFVVQLKIGDKDLGEVIVDPLKKICRTNGGVHAVLGN